MDSGAIIVQYAYALCGLWNAVVRITRAPYGWLPGVPTGKRSGEPSRRMSSAWWPVIRERSEGSVRASTV